MTANTVMGSMERIGRYRLSERIGAGSFATVYRGHDDDLDVPVAVKVLADNWADNEDVRNRFVSEARLMRRIRDDRIVRVYDIGTLDDGRPYFVMDYANAGSLDDLRKNPVEPGRAMHLVADAARALEVLHRNSVIHRDVTPGNILLNRSTDGEIHVLIADLGVAKSMVGASGATMTAGTPAYMAIEQATGIGQLDQRADIYSIGAVAYALLSGRPPFPVRSLADLLSRDQNIAAPPIAARVGAPPALDALLIAAMAPDPNRRPQSAAEFATELDKIAEQMPGGQDYNARPLPAPDRTTLRTSPSSSSPSSMQPIPPASAFGPQRGFAPSPVPAPAMFGQGMPQQQMSPTTFASFATAPVAPREVAPPMMTSYEAPAQADQGRRGVVFWAWVAVGGLALFTIALVVTMLITS